MCSSEIHSMNVWLLKKNKKQKKQNLQEAENDLIKNQKLYIHRATSM